MRSTAQDAEREFVLAHGLNPDNVIRFVRKGNADVEFHMILESAPPQVAEMLRRHPNTSLVLTATRHGSGEDAQV